MEKEILTKQIIRKELLHTHKNDILACALIVPLTFVILFFPMLFLVYALFGSGKTGLLITLGISVAIAVCTLIFSLREIIKIKKGSFHITEDKLVGIEERIAEAFELEPA